MGVLYITIVVVFVLAVLAVAALALFELSPFARHADQLVDPRTGRHQWPESPHLETRDEFERRTHDTQA